MSTKPPAGSVRNEAWTLPIGRFVSVLDFDGAGWVPVTVMEASLIEEWGGDVVFTTMTQRQYWARQENALAARTVSAVVRPSGEGSEG